MSAPIALDFITTRLREAGWPRRSGLLRRYRFDAAVVDATVDEMIDSAAAVGAGRPMLAVQIVADIMDDCATHGEDVPTLEALVEQARAVPDETRAPHERVRPVRFADAVGAMIRQSTLSSLAVRAALQHWCLEGLAWGLMNPRAFERWCRSASIPDSGLTVTDNSVGRPRSTSSDVFAGLDQALRTFERETGRLQPAPPELVAFVRSFRPEL